MAAAAITGTVQRTNLVPNPGFEYDTVGATPAAWGPFALAVNPTLSVINTWSQFGTKALHVSNPAGAAGEYAGASVALGAVSPGDQIVFSVYVHDSNVPINVYYYVNITFYNDVFTGQGNVQSGGAAGVGTVQRLSIWSTGAPAGTTLAYAYVFLYNFTGATANMAFDFDGALCEKGKISVDAWFSGDSSPGGYYWTGTPGNSTSILAPVSSASVSSNTGSVTAPTKVQPAASSSTSLNSALVTAKQPVIPAAMNAVSTATLYTLGIPQPITPDPVNAVSSNRAQISYPIAVVLDHSAGSSFNIATVSAPKWISPDICSGTSTTKVTWTYASSGDGVVVSFQMADTCYFFTPAGFVNDPNNTANCITKDAADNVYIGGEFLNFGVPYLSVLKLKPDMTPDLSWGNQGWWLLNAANWTGTEIQGIAVDAATGKVYIGGGVVEFGFDGFIIARINANGTTDTSFNGTGYNLAEPDASGGIGALGFGVAIQSDGKPVICGSAIRASDNGQHMFTTRFLTTGAVDTAYGVNGTCWAVTSNAGGGAAWGIVKDLSTDKMYLGGVSQDIWNRTNVGAISPNDVQFTISDASLLAPGMTMTIEPGVAGKEETVSVLRTVGSTVYLATNAFAYSHASGSTVRITLTKQVCARITATGALDTTFNGTGYNAQTFGIASNGLAIRLQSDGKPIVVGGGFVNTPTGGQIALQYTRYTTAGVLDPTYGNGGYIEDTANAVNGLDIDPANNIITADLAGKWLSTRRAPDGTVDIQFGINGRVPRPTPKRSRYTPLWMTPNGVVVRGDGHIVFAGTGLDKNGTQTFGVVHCDSRGIPISAGWPALQGATTVKGDGEHFDVWAAINDNAGGPFSVCDNELKVACADEPLLVGLEY